MKVGLVVFFTEEAGFMVMPALHDVQRNIIKMDARAAGHGDHHSKINVSLAPLILACWPQDWASLVEVTMAYYFRCAQ